MGAVWRQVMREVHGAHPPGSSRCSVLRSSVHRLISSSSSLPGGRAGEEVPALCT